MLTRITDRCYSLPCDHTADRPALGYVRGDRLSLRIDAGNSPAHSHLMENALRSAGLPAAGLTALTHSHWDHTYGLCAASAPAIACAATQAHLAAMSRWDWTPEAMQARLDAREDIPFCHDAILVEYPDPCQIRVRTADVTFDDRLMLDLGGVHAALMRLENSHADDCVVIHIPEERVIYLGDICYEDLHHDPVCWHRSRFEALCAALKSLDFAYAVPGHQGMKTREELMQDLSERLRDGLPVLD